MRNTLTDESYKHLVANLPCLPFNKGGIICFTGHRPKKQNDPLFGYDCTSEGNTRMLLALRDIIEYYIQHGALTFITGMALGVDMWAARLLFALKAQYPHIKDHAYVPCHEQYASWPAQTTAEWHSIIEQCDKVVYVTEQTYTPSCMQERNEAMVNASDLTIAVWNGSNSGTKNCVDYAIRQDVPVAVLHPKSLAVSAS